MALKVYGLGRLSKEPELRFTQSNKEVVSVDMAFDRGFGENKTADFIPVVFWGEKAKAVSQYTRKGDRLLIEGEVQVRKWQTKEGENRYTTEVRCLEFVFIESSKRDTIEQPFYEEQQEVTPDNFMGDTDDLPFKPMTKHQLEFQKRELENNIEVLKSQLERANKILEDKLAAKSKHTETNVTHIENITHKLECYHRLLDGVLKQLNETD